MPFSLNPFYQDNFVYEWFYCISTFWFKSFLPTLPAPVNLGLFLVFLLGDLRQLFREDHPNTGISFLLHAICLFFFWFFGPKLSLICTSLFVNERFYFQMSVISLDIKRIKTSDYKTNVCWVFLEGSAHSFSNGAFHTPQRKLPGLSGDSHPPRRWRKRHTAGILALLLNSRTTRLWLSLSRKNIQLL